MAYRKIIVDGVEHEYTVGKTHIKIKGIEAFEKADYAPRTPEIMRCDCCGEFTTVYSEPDPNFAVTPELIERLIRIHWPE